MGKSTFDTYHYVQCAHAREGSIYRSPWRRVWAGGDLYLTSRTEYTKSAFMDLPDAEADLDNADNKALKVTEELVSWVGSIFAVTLLTECRHHDHSLGSTETVTKPGISLLLILLLNSHLLLLDCNYKPTNWNELYSIEKPFFLETPQPLYSARMNLPSWLADKDTELFCQKYSPVILFS